MFADAEEETYVVKATRSFYSVCERSFVGRNMALHGIAVIFHIGDVVAKITDVAERRTKSDEACKGVHWVRIAKSKYLRFHFEISEGQNTKIPSKYQNPFEV